MKTRSRLGRCPDWSKSLLSTQVILLFCCAPAHINITPGLNMFASCNFMQKHLSCLMTKPTKWFVHPAKTQICLGILPVRSESWLCALWVTKDRSYLHAIAKTLIRLGGCPGWSVFAERKSQFVGFVMRQLTLSQPSHCFHPLLPPNFLAQLINN